MKLIQLNESSLIVKWIIAISLFGGVAVLNSAYPSERWPDNLWVVTAFSPILWGITKSLWRILLNEVLIIFWITLVEWASGGFVKRDETALLLAAISGITIVTLLLYYHAKQMERAQHMLEEIASRDPLTNLFNRRVLHFFFNQEIARSQSYGRTFSVFILDIDHFKRINDTYGHLIGDKVIQQISNTLKTELRSTDIVFRYGGEEFVALLPETELRNALAVAEHMRGIVEKMSYPLESSKVIQYTVSIGVAEFQEYESWTDVLERADRALYLAKTSGRNCCEVLT